MYSELREVLRSLLTLIHRECGPKKRSCGGLMVAMTALHHHPVSLTVSAAGAWCKKVSKSALQDVLDRLSLRVTCCDCIHKEELRKFTDSFGGLHFTFSFCGGHTNSERMEAEQTEIQMFLHRLSLVNAQVKITLEITTDSKKHQINFSGEAGNKVSMMDQSIILDIAAYGLSPFSAQCLPSCLKVHPVLGDTFSCVLTSDAIGEGLCGEMRMATMATLAPCMDQYPNWPTHLSNIQIIMYSPCGMPLMPKTQMTFLQNLATSLSWADLGICKVSCMEAKTIEGSLCPEIKFSVDFSYQSVESGCCSPVLQNSEPELTQVVEQNLTLFIFTHYTDPFHSQVSDFISSEEALERHLDSVLWYNGDQVRAALQSTLKNTLKCFQKRQNARQRLQSAITTVQSSVNSIIASSCNAKFRNTCYDGMRVTNTFEFRVSLKQSLKAVMDGRFTPKRVCSNEKMAEADCSNHSSMESWEEEFENAPELPLKRNDGDLESSCSIPKKRECSPFPDTPDSFMNVRNSDVFETSSIQRSPLSPIQLPQSKQTRKTQDVPSVHSLTKRTKQKNEQVEKQWLQELENFSEWD